MKKFLLYFALLGAILTPSLLATPAIAQATRTWVSGVGDDANPCSRTAPCKTFAGAISKTAAGGEINCLDPGGFGGVTITKSLTISCDVEAGVLVSGTNGITINAATTDIISLRGLDIEGLGTGLIGVSILSANRVHIENCFIRNFRSGTAAGVATSGTAGIVVFITNTIIGNNGTGVKLQSTGGFKVADLTNVTITGSAGNGVEMTNTSTFANVGNSLISFNSGSGIAVLTASSGASVDQTQLSNHAVSALNAAASGALINASANNIYGNTAAFAIAGGATIASTGDNKIGSGQGAVAPNGTLLKQ